MECRTVHSGARALGATQHVGVIRFGRHTVQVLPKIYNWASEWDGSLPADVFFGVWADFQRQERRVELRARIVEGRLQLSTEPGSSIHACENRIRLEDGRELVIELEPA